MSSIDYYTIFYLFFRLLPMLTASVLTIAPLFNHNLRGFVYLVGLILSTATISSVGNYADMVNPPEPNAVCHAFTLTLNHAYARVPLDLGVLGFTFAYLFVFMYTNGLMSINIPTLLFFPIAILLTFRWLVQNSCFSVSSCILSIVVSTAFGVAWGYIVKKQMPKFQYLYANSNREACVRQSNDTYKCSDVDGNGNLN